VRSDELPKYRVFWVIMLNEFWGKGLWKMRVKSAEEKKERKSEGGGGKDHELAPCWVCCVGLGVSKKMGGNIDAQEKKKKSRRVPVLV